MKDSTPFFPEQRKANTPVIRAKVWLKDKGICYRCNRQVLAGEVWHSDHKKALADGGSNDLENLFVCHEVCHVVKSGEEAAARVKPRRLYKKHNNIIRPISQLKNQGFAKGSKPITTKSPLPPRALYKEPTE